MSIEQFYKPSPVPSDPKDLQRFLQEELTQINLALILISQGYVTIANVAPDKPRDGMIRLADGTNWDPGSGQGVYVYYGSAWNKL